MSSRTLKLITQILLLSVIAIVPFLKANTLYFPFVSGKAYIFRLLVSLAFFFWVWLILKEQSEKRKAKSSFSIFKNILVTAVVLFFLGQALVSFFGVDPLMSFFSTIERADGVFEYGFWVLFCLMLISVFRKEQEWKSLFYVFIIVAVLISFYSWAHYKDQIRLYGIFGNSSYLAVFLIFAIGFASIILERNFLKDIFSKAALSGTILFFVISLIFTQTRGAYVGLFGGIFLFLLLVALFLRKENKKLSLYCGITLLLGLIIISSLFIARKTSFVQNIYVLKHATEIADLWQNDVVRERLLVWQIALKSFKDKPVFGWGPENFSSAANKFYDYRVGMAEPWFDRAHSQPLDTLATGGIVLFSFYLFWMATAVYAIFRISKSKKVLSFVLASVFFAYFLQGLFLFDVLPTFLGLFPFLGFLAFQYNSIYFAGNNASEENYQLQKKEISDRKKKNDLNNKVPLYILLPVACFSLFLIYTTVYLPYRANVLALKFYAYTEGGTYKGSKSLMEQSFSIKSPYTFWEMRKRTAWQIVSVLDYGVDDKTKPEDIAAIKEIYDYITPKLEDFVQNRPYDPQIYYILGRIYRLGFEKFGENDLDKAEKVLKKGFNYSDSRIEYFNELIPTLILEGKNDEAESLIKEFMTKQKFSDNSSGYKILGSFYFITNNYELAWEQYEKAREAGYKFYENEGDYARYMFSAEQLKQYQAIVDMANKHLETWGPDADTFYNIALGYSFLGEKDKAGEFFQKAVELNSKYEQYRSFFENL